MARKKGYKFVDIDNEIEYNKINKDTHFSLAMLFPSFFIGLSGIIFAIIITKPELILLVYFLLAVALLCLVGFMFWIMILTKIEKKLSNLLIKKDKLQNAKKNRRKNR